MATRIATLPPHTGERVLPTESCTSSLANVFERGHSRVDLSTQSFDSLATRIKSVQKLPAPVSSWAIDTGQNILLYMKLVLQFFHLNKILPAAFQFTLREQASELRQILNQLQLDRLVSPLHCVLLKRAAAHLTTPAGTREFQEILLLLFQSQPSLSQETLSQLNSKVASGHCKEALQHLYLSLLTRQQGTPVDVSSAYKVQIEQQSRHYLLTAITRLPITHLQALEPIQRAVRNNDRQAFISQLDVLLKAAETTPGIHTLRLEYCKELAAKLQVLRGNPFIEVANLFKSEDFYKECSHQIKESCHSTEQQLSFSSATSPDQVIASTSKTYQLAQLFLQDSSNLPLPSETQSALLTGIATRAFRIVDDLASTRAGRSLHLFCGCHLNSGTAGKHTPFMRPPELDRATIKWKMTPPTVHDRGLKDRSMMIMSFGVGGAHNTLQRALAQRVAEEGAHVYLGDGAEDALKESDLVYRTAKKLGIKYTTAEFLDWSNRKEYWKLLVYMHKFFGGTEESPKTLAEKDALMRRFFLERSPDGVMTTYARHSGVMSRVCDQMGLGLYSDNTDFDPELVDITSPPQGHFVHAVHVDTPEVRRYLKQGEAPYSFVNKQDVLRDDQIAEGGLPVQNGFFLRGGEAALRTKYQVEPDAQVVVIMSGGGGSTSLFAEQIHNRYKQADASSLPKLHVFVVCGNNPPEKTRCDKILGIPGEQQPARHAQGKVAFTVYPSIPGDSDNPSQASVSELMRMAQHKTPDGREGLILSGKGGGGTFSEAAAVGVRVAARDYSPWTWEKFNMKLWCQDYGMGTIFTKNEEMWPSIHQMLNTPRTTPAPFAAMNSKEKSMGILRQLVQRTDQDAPFAAKRAAFREI